MGRTGPPCVSIPKATDLCALRHVQLGGATGQHGTTESLPTRGKDSVVPWTRPTEEWCRRAESRNLLPLQRSRTAISLNPHGTTESLRRGNPRDGRGAEHGQVPETPPPPPCCWARSQRGQMSTWRRHRVQRNSRASSIVPSAREGWTGRLRRAGGSGSCRVPSHRADHPWWAGHGVGENEGTKIYDARRAPWTNPEYVDDRRALAGETRAAT